MKRVELLTGDCLSKLKSLPDNSIDSCVTDPPYGLSKEPDIAKVMQHWIDDDDYMHTAKGFMGKAWDSFVPGPKYWREVMRVLKPGGYALVFGGTRTYDMMTIAMRFAGFEVRDTLCWLYGSGFPKSLDVSKAIDKQRGDEKNRPIARKNVSHRKHQVGPGGWINAARPEYKTSAASAASAAWEGWGTALKPAHEPIIMARKPLSEKTVAANVLKWGTGAINIDGGRIAGPKRSPEFRSPKSKGQFGSSDNSELVNWDASQGRFPANLLLDEYAAAELDRQSGRLKSGTGPVTADMSPMGYGKGGKGSAREMYGDSGGASRFFYVAKASRRERNAGLEGMQKKFSPTMGNGIGKREHDPKDPKAHTQNFHPTVKPLTLMRYLVRLVTPPGGTVLDPFAGSGSTGCAAVAENFGFLGIEREPEYAAIALKRVEHHAELVE